MNFKKTNDKEVINIINGNIQFMIPQGLMKEDVHMKIFLRTLNKIVNVIIILLHILKLTFQMRQINIIFHGFQIGLFGCTL